MLRWLAFGAGVATTGLLVTHNIVALCVALAVEAFFDRGASAVRSGLIARIATGGRGVRFRAYLRAVTNVGISVGAGLGGLALLVDRPWAYLGVFALNAVTFVVTAALLGRLPHLAPAPPRAEGESRQQVLRDRPYVLVSVLTGVFAMHFFVIDLAMPLWIATRTEAPKSLVAITLLVNTVAVALFQVRLSRGSATVGAAARTMLIGSFWVLGGFALISLADSRAVWAAVTLLLAGAGVHVVGEMIGSSGQWGVQMGLAPQERQVQYQGFAGMSFSIASILAPPRVVLLYIDWGGPGWFVMGGTVVVAAALNVLATRWALRTRGSHGVRTHTG